MTTAVISPASFQQIPGLGWNGRNASTGGFSAMSSEDSSRMFMPPRKTVQRSSSSSSLASTSSTSSTSTVQQADTSANAQIDGDAASTAVKKKPRGGFWPVSKAESTSGISNARANGAVQPANPSAANGLGKSALAPTSNATNNARTANGQGGAMEQMAILALLPMNGTFERKQINVPFYPDILKIGRQTNAKTVPTQFNGYFDSKVLSRQHAEIWAERASGKVWIRDVKSSNGTFVNAQRLSPENRESEPHELRQQDTLELGIDIVSEDQKTIVHHKVSAKVEYAGMPGSSNNVLDLNFGDLDPSHGGSMLGPPLSQRMDRSAGRQGPQPNGRGSAAPSIISGQVSSVAQQRQANFWGAPLNVEQLVKHLTTEMRAAKQQAQDLDHANTYLNSMIVTDNGSSKIQAPPAELSFGRQPSMRARGSRVDHAARFGDPPAPPPQQPLPEKPDSAKNSPVNVSSMERMLKRAETAKQPNGIGHSPAGSQDVDVSSLAQALEKVTKDRDSQSVRVKELEDMLKQERAAREAAEEKARRIEETVSARTVSIAEPESATAPITATESDRTNAQNPDSESEADKLQQRLDQVLLDMQRMKSDMDRATRRAESAEKDASAARTSLAEMIERLRRESDAAVAPLKANHEALDSSQGPLFPSNVPLQQENQQGADRGQTLTLPSEKQNELSVQPNGHIRKPSFLPHQLERAMATVLRESHSGSGEITAQSAPYVSMVGVVLIGVGLMAYLNSLQRGEK